MKAPEIVFFVVCLVIATVCAEQVPDVHTHGHEWTMKLKTPPCASHQNMQVIFPAKPGDALEIECDNLEVSK